MRYVVHYGAMQLLGVFSYSDAAFCYGSRVVVRTPRGQEVGIVRCEATPDVLEKLDSKIHEDKIVRPLSDTDEKTLQRLTKKGRDNFRRCERILQDSGNVMDLVRLEYIFGGERLVVYYTADERIDFRELVKVLTSDFGIRIEMRQISMREKVKLLTHFGDCGREICCSYMHESRSVSIKMAKIQRVSLDPAKISGHCGRLKCCLGYEHEHYCSVQMSKEQSVNEQSKKNA